MTKRPWCLLAVFLLVRASVALGQGSAADYARAAELSARLRGKVFRDEVRPHWQPNQSVFWYRVKTSEQDAEFVLVDAAAGVRRPAFDHARLAAQLTAELGRSIEPTQLPFSSITLDAAADGLRFSVDGVDWQWDARNETLRRSEDDDLSAPATVRVRASRDGGQETQLRFVNRTSEPMEIFWINQRGRRISYGRLEAGQDRRQHTYVGHAWLATDPRGKAAAYFEAADDEDEAVIDGAMQVVDVDAQAESAAVDRRDDDRSISPDKSWRARVEADNVVLSDLRTDADADATLTTDGAPENPYLDRVYWSPDSRRLVVVQESVVEQRRIPLIESRPDDQLQPKLQEFDYTKPGDRIPHAVPRLFDVATLQPIEISDALFPQPWSITEIRWPAADRFTFLYNQRGHQVLRIVEVDAHSGEARALVDEQSPTFIDYAHKKFTHYLDESQEILWMSERDGWNHLYLYDARTGQVKNQITAGSWVVRGVERVDEATRRVWFRASGVYPEQDPYYIHYGRVDFDGSHLTWLTQGDGTHEIEYAPDGEYFLDRYSRVDLPPVTELRRSDGTMICELERGDASEFFAAGGRTPERFVARGRDGETGIHGVIHRPTNFAAGRKYPVIEKIYAGPQGAFVPKDFAAFRREQELAELGFIVVQIDGMGTSHRSKAFHDVCWKNLGDAGFPDRICWLRAAAETHPELDLSRVGVYGGSAGGQSALRGLLVHGDVYHVGVADCGCHDNRMDKIWWNELWMGWPLGPEYEEQSNVTQAHRLQGKLLLTVGELDRNVDPASTMQVVDALIKADKDFDLLVVPGAGHGVGETPYANRRRQDFFVRHLLGVEPRW